MSEIVEIATIFRAVFEKRPLPPAPRYDGDPPVSWLADRGRRYRHVRDVIVAELRATGLAAVIVTEGRRIDVPAHDLRRASAARLGGAGRLSTELWALRGYRDFSGIVFVPAEIKARAVKTACEELGAAGKRGRPGKVEQVRAAYRARFPNGHEAEGLPLKNVAGEIGVDVSDRTIQRAISEE